MSENITSLIFMRKNKAFTLVELIVVITILAILATIAFLSFGGYSANARDSARLSDMTNLSKGLSLYQTKAGNLPLPERKIDITAGATTIGYQGYADSQTLSNISASDMKDPLDSERYTYATNKNLTKYQILGFLEGNDTLTFSPVEQSYATTPTTYTNRYPISKGDTIGILTDAVTKIPAQAIAGTTTISTSTTSTGYSIYFDTKDTIASATGSTLFSNIYNRRSDLITDKTIASQDASLVGYWDMTPNSGGTGVTDASQYGNTGILMADSTNIPVFTDDSNRMRGKTLLFNGAGGGLRVPKSNSLTGTLNITISAWIKPNILNAINTVVSRHGDTTDALGTLNIEPSRANFYLRTTTGFTNVYGKSNRYVVDNVWHLISATYDGSTLRVYYDGTIDAQSSYSGNIQSVNGYRDTYIGRYTGSSSATFSGLIDDVRIYNRALSDSEITTLYNATK